MSKEKRIAVLLCIVAVCFYIAAAVVFIFCEDTSMGVVWVCLGSSMLCFASVWLNKHAMKEDEPTLKEHDSSND